MEQPKKNGLSPEMKALVKSRQKEADKLSSSSGFTKLSDDNGGARKAEFDYIEKFTKKQQWLTTPASVVQKNYIKASVAEAQQNADAQGFGGEVVGFLAQSVIGEIALGTVEGVGYLLDVDHWGSKAMGGEGDWDNWLSELARSGKEGVREIAPIYLDPSKQGQGIGTSMGDFAWWMSNGVSVASALSILIPVAGWARGVGLAGKGMNLLSQGARVGKWGAKAAKATKTVDKVMDAMPMMPKTMKAGLDGIHKATVSRLIESQMEATGVFTEKYEWYKDNTDLTDDEAKKAAAEAASFTYKWNWAA